MRRKYYSINLLSVIGLPTAFILGYLGKVDWWTILVILLLSLEFNLNWERKRA